MFEGSHLKMDEVSCKNRTATKWAEKKIEYETPKFPPQNILVLTRCCEFENFPWACLEDYGPHLKMASQSFCRMKYRRPEWYVFFILIFYAGSSSMLKMWANIPSKNGIGSSWFLCKRRPKKVWTPKKKTYLKFQKIDRLLRSCLDV